MTKSQIADVLQEIATLLELNDENPFKIRAYANAARSLETFRIFSIWADCRRSGIASKRFGDAPRCAPGRCRRKLSAAPGNCARCRSCSGDEKACGDYGILRQTPTGGIDHCPGADENECPIAFWHPMRSSRRQLVGISSCVPSLYTLVRDQQ